MFSSPFFFLTPSTNFIANSCRSAARISSIFVFLLHLQGTPWVLLSSFILRVTNFFVSQKRILRQLQRTSLTYRSPFFTECLHKQPCRGGKWRHQYPHKWGYGNRKYFTRVPDVYKKQKWPHTFCITIESILLHCSVHQNVRPPWR